MNQIIQMMARCGQELCMIQTTESTCKSTGVVGHPVVKELNTDRRDISTNQTTGHSNYLLTVVLVALGTPRARFTWNCLEIWSSVVTS